MSRRDSSPDERPNWVDETDSCRPDRVFEDLVEAVETDVAAMQRLSDRARQGCNFVVQRANDMPQFCSVYRRPVNDDTMSLQSHVSFDCVRGAVTVRPKGEEEFTVSAEADPQTGLRVLMIEEERLELWQVSRRILDSLFFGFERLPGW